MLYRQCSLRYGSKQSYPWIVSGNPHCQDIFLSKFSIEIQKQSEISNIIKRYQALNERFTIALDEGLDNLNFCVWQFLNTREIIDVL